MTTTTRAATGDDTAAMACIYNAGIEERVATFETRLRTAADIATWLDSRHPVVVAEEDGAVRGFAAAFPNRDRSCYDGVAEFSIYVAPDARGRGLGTATMEELLARCRTSGFWKLVSRIFPENRASLALLARLGFRTVGRYERHAKLEGVWRDVLVVERHL